MLDSLDSLLSSFLDDELRVALNDCNHLPPPPEMSSEPIPSALQVLRTCSPSPSLGVASSMRLVADQHFELEVERQEWTNLD